jgi:hypothetical protein
MAGDVPVGLLVTERETAELFGVTVSALHVWRRRLPDAPQPRQEDGRNYSSLMTSLLGGAGSRRDSAGPASRRLSHTANALAVPWRPAAPRRTRAFIVRKSRSRTG